MIAFNCFGCGKPLKARNEYAGKKCRCTGCQRINVVPEPAEQATTQAIDHYDFEFDNIAEVVEEQPVVLKPSRKADQPKPKSVQPTPIFSTFLMCLTIIVLVASIFGLIVYTTMDTTVSSDFGLTRTHNMPLAQQQLKGLITCGIFAGLSLGMLFYLRRR